MDETETELVVSTPTKTRCFRLTRQLDAQLRVIAADAGVSVNAVIVGAVMSRIKNWKNPLTGKKAEERWRSGWPKHAVCFECNTLGHDPGLVNSMHPRGIPDWAWDELPEHERIGRKMLARTRNAEKQASDEE